MTSHPMTSLWISTLSFSTWPAIARLIGDHLWQSTLFATFVGLLTLAFRKNHAQVRNGLWFAASLKFLIPFVALVAIGNHFGSRRTAPLAQNPASFVFDMDTVSQPFSHLAPAAPPAATSHNLAYAIPIAILAIWLCGFAAILLTWWANWRRISMVIRNASPIRQGPELDALRRIESLAGVAKPLRILSSSASLEPGILGIANPVLLWPLNISERLDNKQVEMILAHELSHVRRRDNLAAAIHMLVEALFWFHPLVWWIGARIVDERERACDEDVLRMGGDPQVYAESILKVCEFYLESPLACMSGVTGSDLKKRMERIMSNHIGETLNNWGKLLVAAAGVVALTVPLLAGVLTAPRLQAQTPNAATAPPPTSDKPKFDAVSIKPSQSENQYLGGQPGGLFRANITLRGIIARAYLKGFPPKVRSVLGGPGWLDSQRFEIEAKAIGNPSREQESLMIQSLLEDRFKLVLHHETRQLPIYALVVAKEGKIGLQLTPHASDAKCTDTSTGKGLSQPKPGDAMPAYCGGFFVNPRPGDLRETGNGVSMDELGAQLIQFLDRDVVDRTGLGGVFDFNLEFAPLTGPGALPDTASGASDPSAPPTLFVALQQQLGLKLEPQKGPVDVFVIDHIEHPSPN